GLVFDRDSLLAPPFRGDGFVMSFMPGGDSIGYTPLSPWGSPCPFVDPSRELVQMKLSYNASIDNYTMTTSNIVEGFYLPVDAELINHELYVIENGWCLWKVTFPKYTGLKEIEGATHLAIYPNPFQNSTTITFDNPNHVQYSLSVYNAYGQTVRTLNNIETNNIEFDRLSLASGIYFLKLESASKAIIVGRLIIE
ncbi:MAG: T9SS type A sorting domain-containing protein, partial [Bacteroidetes bacterium]|nr:T9SS type A sorting domain-containing protein [Bacteroidota bacterium]